MEGSRRRPWSDLPPEILSMIGSRLHTRIDILRFRSVCSSFRSSITPLHRDAPRFPFRIPCSPEPNLFLRESMIYTVETPADGAATSRAWWLLKLEESELGDTRILSLFSRCPIRPLPRKFPEVLDCLQSRIIEICREYRLEYSSRKGGGTQKVVVHPDCARICFIDRESQLFYWKYGDENWSHLGWGYDDIVVCEGKVCVVDKWGLVSQIHSSFRLQSSSLPINGLCGCRRHHRKHLVVSNGDLYVVDECFTIGLMSDFRVYGLDQQRRGWEVVRSLGKSAFFLCNGRSFAVSACELGRFEGDCIYYVENASSYSSYFWKHEKVKAFSLVDCSHEDVEFSGLFRLVKKGN